MLRRALNTIALIAILVAAAWLVSMPMPTTTANPIGPIDPPMIATSMPEVNFIVSKNDQGEIGRAIDMIIKGATGIAIRLWWATINLKFVWP